MERRSAKNTAELKILDGKYFLYDHTGKCLFDQGHESLGDVFRYAFQHGVRYAHGPGTSWGVGLIRSIPEEYCKVKYVR